jgi:nucleoside-diphosphate-sugar epimerase
VKRKTALVAGALGIVGRSVVAHLATLDDWDVIALSRRAPEFASSARWISVNLLDRGDCEQKLRDLSAVTHVFFAAYAEQTTEQAQVDVNLALLANLTETIDAVADVQRIVLVEGAKWYGAHLGPYKTPAKESDPRVLPPNFYYDQEDYLAARASRGGGTWAAVRPSGICGFAVGNPMNVATALAVYATITRELGLPLRFPGKPGAYRTLIEYTDATHLARAMVWAATSDAAANEAFNITNGDLARWEHLWPQLVAFFDMDAAPPLHMPLVRFMADKGPLWDRIVERYHLKPYTFAEIAAWPFLDGMLGLEYDVISDTGKVRRAGFHDAVDTEAMFVRTFAQFRADRIIP